MSLEQIIKEIEKWGYSWEMGVDERHGIAMASGSVIRRYWMEVFNESKMEIRVNNEESPIDAAKTILSKLNN